MDKLINKVPVLRFPEFKDTWEHKQLSELLFEAKKRNNALNYGKDEVLSVSGEFGIVNQIEHLGRSYAGESVHNYHIVETGDIVYTKSPLKANPYGIIKLNKGKPGIVSTLYAVYKLNDKTANGYFLDYYFSLDANTNRYLRPLVKKGAKNTLQVDNKTVIKAKIYLPSLPEQHQIASFLISIDRKLNQLKKRKSLLEQYKKGIMQKLFSQEIRFKDDKGNDFPAWEEKKLGEVATKIGDGLHGTPEYAINTGIFFINGNNLIEGKINITENTKQVIKDELIKNEKGLTANTLLISINGTIGNIARYNNEKVMLGKSVGYFIFKNDCSFYFHLLNSPNIQNHFISELTGTTIKNLSLKTLRETQIQLPSLPEQTKIANFLSAIDEKIGHCQAQIEKTEQYKKGLLQKMFC